jgi:hemolysin activation/secretion protein
MTLRHPFYRTLGDEVAGGLAFENRRNENFLLGRPFSFSAGTDNGKSVVSALRVTPEWIHRTPTQVLAFRSRFSFGLDVLGATINNGPLPSGQFIAWLGQFQWARRLGTWGVETIARADVQLTPDRLLSLEQFTVGGSQSVRGYRENALVRDNGAVGSLEARFPVVRSKQGVDIFQVAPFFDAGTAWSAHGTTPDPRYLASVGLGLRWAVMTDVTAQVYWGYKLKDVPRPGDDPQDKGVHFSVAWQFTLPEGIADLLPPWRESRAPKTF